MFRHATNPLIIILVILNFCWIINAQHLQLCESLNDLQGNETEKNNSEGKSRRIRALCEAIYSSRALSDRDEWDSIPDFDLTQIDSDNDANQILKRFRRGRGGGGRSGGGGRFSSGFSRSSSSSGSRIFGGSRSSSSSGSSRIFSRSRSSSSSGSGSRIFSRARGSSLSSNTGRQHRIREAVRSMFRHSRSSRPSAIPSASGGLAGAGGSKPGFGNKIRQITHGGGGGGFRSGGGGFGSGIGGASGSGGNVWVRAGKKFLPVAIRFGKRYYQRRKYSKGMYAGIGAGAGYYAGSRMGNHRQSYYQGDYGYPPAHEDPPERVDEKTPTVFYCLQEDLNMTLVNKTLNDEGFGTCNISGKLVTCPIEIECETSESDNCCEDEQGTPFCCGGPIPEEYASPYGGYGDDLYDAAESINQLLNLITAMSVVLATICFTMWHRRAQ